jgi:tRNA U34 5-carboxymethylaminomethyl modifying GTPase MnmE/TrmE
MKPLQISGEDKESYMREAVNALGEITGETVAADILEVMFSRFCVGK